jgi:hypothetical protein
MILKYDFDIFDVVPGQTDMDLELGGFLLQNGLNADDRDNKIALFRDERTANALRNAPPQLRAFFLASGFGLNTYHSGAPENRYPACDEDARLDVIGRLAANAEQFALPKPADYPEGGDVFRLGEFLMHLADAQPEEAPAHIAEPMVAQDLLRDETARRTVVAPSFDRDDSQEVVATAPVKKRFWQTRMFRVAAAVVAVAGVMEIVAGQGIVALASS